MAGQEREQVRINPRYLYEYTFKKAIEDVKRGERLKEGWGLKENIMYFDFDELTVRQLEVIN